jgi:hypothetical protein
MARVTLRELPSTISKLTPQEAIVWMSRKAACRASHATLIILPILESLLK